MSEWYREGLIVERGVHADQCMIVPPTVHLGDWRHRVYPAGDGPLRVLFAGTDFRRRGGDLVLDVVGRPEFARARFDIVGGVEANVAHHGRLGQPDLTDLFDESDLFVLPTWADCSPNVFVEAGASGVPSIGADVGAVS